MPGAGTPGSPSGMTRFVADARRAVWHLRHGGTGQVRQWWRAARPGPSAPARQHPPGRGRHPRGAALAAAAARATPTRPAGGGDPGRLHQPRPGVRVGPGRVAPGPVARAGGLPTATGPAVRRVGLARQRGRVAVPPHGHLGSAPGHRRAGAVVSRARGADGLLEQGGPGPLRGLPRHRPPVRPRLDHRLRPRPRLPPRPRP